MTFNTSILRLFYAFGLFCLSIFLILEDPGCSLVLAQSIHPYATLPLADIARGLDQQPLQRQQQPASVQQQGINSEATCPGADNNTYYTDTGLFYRVQCNRRQWTRAIQRITTDSFQQCIEKCADEPACKSVNYYPVGDKECTLLSDLGASTTDMETLPDYNHAYEVDPPVQAQDDEPLVPCSTACPTSNGLSYVSSYGETFRMNCGKRHGTPPLGQDIQPSLKYCMESCAAHFSCRSVDFNEAAGYCYYSNHIGDPTIIAPGFSSAWTIGCAGACRSAPLKPPGPPQVDNSCGNQGLAYAIYTNYKADGKPNPTDGGKYPSFDPTLFKKGKIDFTGNTKIIGSPNEKTVYGNKPKDPGYVTVNHRGYIFAQQTGEYTFTIPAADDIVLLWTGSNAYSGYTRANANLLQVWPASATLTYKAKFSQGDYIPFRIMWANGGGDGSFKFELRAPDGSVIIGSDTGKESPYLVQYSCDGATAPRFLPFGSET